jgi:hypothetical protein
MLEMPLKYRKFTVVMSLRPVRFIVVLSLFLLPCLKLSAQKSAADTILLGAVVENEDTIAMIFLPDFEVKDRLPKHWVRKQESFNRLKYNVYKVYPYAVIAAGVLKDVNANVAMMPDKKARKTYMKSVERELKAKFKGELENLSISQGQVLVKLINRQTGQNCFSIIKEVKGGFNAVVWQSIALLFSNNLKREYDPAGDDRDMEAIVKELEANNYYRYQYYKQQQLQQMQSRK